MIIISGSIIIIVIISFIHSFIHKFIFYVKYHVFLYSLVLIQTDRWKFQIFSRFTGVDWSLIYESSPYH